MEDCGPEQVSTEEASPADLGYLALTWGAVLRSYGRPSHCTLVLLYKSMVEIPSPGSRMKELEGHARTCSQVYRIPAVALRIGGDWGGPFRWAGLKGL